MGELVLLVVAAAWAAVLIPPLLRSRLENRPNSSVTDFRRQLNKLQSTVPSRSAGPMRGMARPLAQSPGQRPTVSSRTVQPANLRRGAGGRSHGIDPRETQRTRVHGDPSGGYGRPEMPRRVHGSRDHRLQHDGHRERYDDRGPVRGGVSTDELRRRRGNVMVALVLTTAATFFLAASTKAQLFYYLFALSFLALFGFAFMLSQARQRDGRNWPSDWMQY
ncbi:MAG: hypothetical protein RLZZ01_2393 [Actinomycetota bacterium]|jgi:hypothetical protein